MQETHICGSCRRVGEEVLYKIGTNIINNRVIALETKWNYYMEDLCESGRNNDLRKFGTLFYKKIWKLR